MRRKDMRKTHRYPRLRTVECEALGKSVSGHLVNISQTGALFRSKTSVAKGTVIRLHFPEFFGYSRPLEGKVIRTSNSVASIHQTIAVRFNLHSKMDHAVVAEVIESGVNSGDGAGFYGSSLIHFIGKTFIYAAIGTIIIIILANYFNFFAN